jgi:hypothetical protein
MTTLMPHRVRRREVYRDIHVPPAVGVRAILAGRRQRVDHARHRAPVFAGEAFDHPAHLAVPDQ